MTEYFGAGTLENFAATSSRCKWIPWRDNWCTRAKCEGVNGLQKEIIKRHRRPKFSRQQLKNKKCDPSVFHNFLRHKVKHLFFFWWSDRSSNKKYMLARQRRHYFWQNCLRCLIFTSSQSSSAELPRRGLQPVELVYESNCGLRSHIITKTNRVSSTPILPSEEQLSLLRFKSKVKYLLFFVFG